MTDEATVIEELQVLYLEQLQGPSYDYETLLLLRSIVTFLDITRRLDKVSLRHNAEQQTSPRTVICCASTSTSTLTSTFTNRLLLLWRVIVRLTKL